MNGHCAIIRTKYSLFPMRLPRGVGEAAILNAYWRICAVRTAQYATSRQSGVQPRDNATQPRDNATQPRDNATQPRRNAVKAIYKKFNINIFNIKLWFLVPKGMSISLKSWNKEIRKKFAHLSSFYTQKLVNKFYRNLKWLLIFPVFH